MNATLTVAEVAERLGVHVVTVRRLIARRELSAVRVGGRLLIGANQVEQLLALAEGRPTMAVAGGSLTMDASRKARP